GYTPVVYRNDQITVADIEALAPAAIVISPGPCTPDQSGVSNEVIRHFAGRVPILGVCLGHQCIAQVFGGKVVRASELMHGKTSQIYHFGGSLYQGIPSPFTATRYHSLVVERKSLPAILEVTAQTADGTIMGLRHRELDVEGVQFHPESILTENGKQLLANFLQRAATKGGNA